jgi:hypothetical protein
MVTKMKKAKKAATVEKVDLSYEDRVALLTFPWKWADGSVEEFKASDIFQYVPAGKRYRFMDELHRVLRPDAKATIVVNYYSSTGSYADPLIEWPPVCEQSFLYFNKEWREVNKVIAPETVSDFDFTYGYALDAETAGRTQDVQVYQVKHYLNSVTRLQVVLTKHIRQQ